jgi:hypothetical protein
MPVRRAGRVKVWTGDDALAPLARRSFCHVCGVTGSQFLQRFEAVLRIQAQLKQAPVLL